MFGHRHRVKCFNATYHAGPYVTRADLGYRNVPVERIVGSVGRCQELDSRFYPLHMNRIRQQRLKTVRELVEQGALLPPVELYKLKDEYFVVDGHHRVAVAKENKAAYIDANVLEFLPEGQCAEDRLYLAFRAFAGETGLDQLRVSHLDGYERLRQEIEEWRRTSAPEATLKDAARAWYLQVFRPVAEIIAATRLPQRIPEHTPADLYLDLSTRRAYELAQGGHEISWQEAARQMAVRYPLPSWRDRLLSRLQDLFATLQARWRGLRDPDDMPCTSALRGADGALYCQRAQRAKHGVFEP
jgi:hypothetical protein